MKLVMTVAIAGMTLASALAQSAPVALKARRVHPAVGAAIENGIVIIRDGVIAAVGADVAIPDGATVIDLGDATITPGLIDACCMLSPEIIVGAGSRFGAAEPQSALAASIFRRKAPKISPNDALAGGGDATEPALSRDARDHETAGRRVARRGDTSLWKELAAHAQREAEHEAAAAHDHAAGDPCGPGCAGPRDPQEAAVMLASGISPRFSWGEHASEVVPHTLVIDSVNLLSNDFPRLRRGGVTTVFVSPDPAAVIGARGAIVRTGGDINERIVRRADAVKAAMGGDPARRGARNMLPGRGSSTDAISFHVRRPTTRMGVDFVFRKAFYDAILAGRGIVPHGADCPPAAALPVLREIMSGEIPLRIQARKSHDLISAIRLTKELGIKKVVLDEAIEAYQVLPELKAAGFPLVYGPIFMEASGWRVFSGEADEPRLNTAARLHQTGIDFALTAVELRDEEGLARQAMVAIANGLPADAALRAVTISPARLLGIADRVGSIETGKRADLLVWSGEPLAATSRVSRVFIGGQEVTE
jgi:imidazolonepropionase-like amidohydrolase